MTINEELREIEERVAGRGPIGYEPKLLRIATEYRELLMEAVGLIEDLCTEWGMWYVAEEFRARIEGEKSNDT